MASTQSFVEYVCDRVSLTNSVSYKKMFGEYALYLDDKLVALVCDEQVFVKPTIEGRRILKTPKESPPYPGAKPCFLVTEQIDDRKLMDSLFSATAKSLPLPKPKKTAKKATL